MDRLCVVLILVIACTGAEAAGGEVPRVHFDMPFVVACRDVSSPEFLAANPDDKLIEARFEISSLLIAGQERDLTEYLIRIESPQRTLAVVDYLPKTLHESKHAKPISVQETDESNASIGINIAGQYEFLTGTGVNAGLGKKHVSCVKQELLPPLETVAASGTLLRGSAVFFKLKASSRQLLEGARDYSLVLRVPAQWRADYVHVYCRAQGIERSFVSSLDQQVICGNRDFVVALYLEGDAAARSTADSFARRQAEVRTSVRKQKHTSGRSAPDRTKAPPPVEFPQLSLR
jgi:hypothetical protein